MAVSPQQLDDAVRSWREDGWALLDGLVAAPEIDQAMAEVDVMVVPTPIGPTRRADQVGARFRAAQFDGTTLFPLPDAPYLNRLIVHPKMVGFAQAAMACDDLRIYQSPRLWSKHAEHTSYEQPMHTDGNHSLVPTRSEVGYWNMECFLYLSDVDETNGAPRIVPRSVDAPGPNGGRRLDPTSARTCSRQKGSRAEVVARCSLIALMFGTAASTCIPAPSATCWSLPSSRQEPTGSASTHIPPWCPVRTSKRSRPRARPTSWPCSAYRAPATPTGQRPWSTLWRTCTPASTSGPGASSCRNVSRGRKPMTRPDPVKGAMAVVAGAFGSLDTALNIAFPDLVADFGLAVGDLQWVVVCYVLSYGALLLAAGQLGDVIGHRLVLGFGAGLSTIALLICALANTFPVLLAGRIVQGIGVSMVMASAPALLTTGAPPRLSGNPGGRGRAIGVFQTSAAVGLAIGPIVGGPLVDFAGWRGVFWFRVPIALGAGRVQSADRPERGTADRNRRTW